MSEEQKPRRRADDERIDQLVKSVECLRQTREANSANIAEIKAQIADIVGFWHTMQEGIKVLGWISKIAKWLTAVAAAVAAIWGATHLGSLPPKP